MLSATSKTTKETEEVLRRIGCQRELLHEIKVRYKEGEMLPEENVQDKKPETYDNGRI